MSHYNCLAVFRAQDSDRAQKSTSIYIDILYIRLPSHAQQLRDSQKYNLVPFDINIKPTFW